MPEDYDIVGYIFEGEIYCPNCFRGDLLDAAVIFAGSEWDRQPYCQTCHEPLDVSVCPPEDSS